MLRPHDVVTIGFSAPDAEVRGRQGYVVGEVTAEQVGVLVYGLERVWCLSPEQVTATGARAIEAAQRPGPAIRVSGKGELIG